MCFCCTLIKLISLRSYLIIIEFPRGKFRFYHPNLEKIGRFFCKGSCLENMSLLEDEELEIKKSPIEALE